MKKIILFCVIAFLASCIGIGKESSKVKFVEYYQVSDGNDNDSTFLVVVYKNKSDIPVENPSIVVTVKDTVTGKLFKNTLKSYSQSLPTQSAKSHFSFKIYTEDFDFNSPEVDKLKFILTWTNSNGKMSLRRYID